MSLFFQDKFGRVIRLSYERIQHIGAHMSLANKLHLVEETLRRPELFLSHEKKHDIFYYQKYLKEFSLYFIIVVKVFNGTGFILTIYHNKIPQQ